MMCCSWRRVQTLLIGIQETAMNKKLELEDEDALLGDAAFELYRLGKIDLSDAVDRSRRRLIGFEKLFKAVMESPEDVEEVE